MTRVRIFAALTASVALLLSSIPLAAQAAPAPTDPAAGNVEVRIQYRDADYVPGTEVDVTFWRLDDADGRYVLSDDVEWTSTGLTWVSSDLEPGSYAVRFVADAAAIGLEWWDDARFFEDSRDITVSEGQTTTLGIVTLDERTIETQRIAGANRFATAAAISQKAAPDGASVVYLTNGMTYPDALAAGPAAFTGDGVLLLTRPHGLPPETATELKRLAPDRVVIVGGTGAVSSGVAQRVQNLLPKAQVARIGGANRYETGERIVRDGFRRGADVAIIATGRNYPDALAAGPAAGMLGAPVILVDGAAKSVPASTMKLLSDLEVQSVIVVGGTGAVSTGVERSLAKAGYTGDDFWRVAGASRYETAAILNAGVFETSDRSYLANGMNFPDALAGGPLAARYGAPMFLSPAACLGWEAASGISANHSNEAVLLGGTGVLSARVENGDVCF